MRFWRRRRGASGPEAGGAGHTDGPAAPQPALSRSSGTAVELAVAPRLERAVVALAACTSQLSDRLATLEQRLDDLADQSGAVPTHADVLDVRAHSARLAAEVSELGAELRGELDRLAGRADHLTAQVDELATTERRHRRVETLAESILDLSDGLDTLPGDVGRAAG